MEKKISLIMGSWKRPHLLELNLWALSRQYIKSNLEIVVCNDYLPDETEAVCKKYTDLDVKYVFTGKRNYPEIKWRSAGYALNIGVKQSSGDIIILTCPEVVQLNNAIDLIVEPLLTNNKLLSIPKEMYFDDSGHTIEFLQNNRSLRLPEDLLTEISADPECKCAVKMPYLMGMYKQEYTEIGGYDEDFSGWACEDNDLIDRLIANGLRYTKTKARIIHLYHGSRCDSRPHPEKASWVVNYNLFLQRKGIIKRNVDREWGKIDE